MILKRPWRVVVAGSRVGIDQRLDRYARVAGVAYVGRVGAHRRLKLGPSSVIGEVRPKDERRQVIGPRRRRHVGDLPTPSEVTSTQVLQKRKVAGTTGSWPRLHGNYAGQRLNRGEIRMSARYWPLALFSFTSTSEVGEILLIVVDHAPADPPRVEELGNPIGQAAAFGLECHPN